MATFYKAQGVAINADGSVSLVVRWHQYTNMRVHQTPPPLLGGFE